MPIDTYNGLQAVPTDTLQGLQAVPSDTFNGLQAVPADENNGRLASHDSQKETVPNRVWMVEHLPERYDRYDQERGKEGASLDTEPPLYQKSEPSKGRLNRKIYGIRAKWALLGLAGLILLIIILGAGLGAGLKSG